MIRAMWIFILSVLIVWRIAAWCIDLWEQDDPAPIMDCSGRGYPVTVNDVFVGCTKDKQTHENIYWMPEPGIPEMRVIQIPDDAWLDAPEP